jgi:hypothetical protein
MLTSIHQPIEMFQPVNILEGKWAGFTVEKYATTAEALLVQSCGQVSPHGSCGRCTRGLGPFGGGCRVLPGVAGGACANCHYRSRAHQCDLHMRNLNAQRTAPRVIFGAPPVNPQPGHIYSSQQVPQQIPQQQQPAQQSLVQPAANFPASAESASVHPGYGTQNSEALEGQHLEEHYTGVMEPIRLLPEDILDMVQGCSQQTSHILALVQRVSSTLSKQLHCEPR